jgi:hypothetical protein
LNCGGFLKSPPGMWWFHAIFSAERLENFVHVGSYECQGSLSDVDNKLLIDFTNFLVMHASVT